jgi:hypothetical protein
MLARIMHVNWVLEPCPRCQGKMFIERDSTSGDSLCCLMCGFNQGILILDSEEKFDLMAKNLNGNYGAGLPQVNNRKIK